jgi:hypothetical protein
MANRQNKADTATEHRYNGWTNYETWAIALWIDNDQATHVYWRQEAERASRESANCEMVRDGVWTSKEAARYNLAEQLKEEITEATPDMEASVYSDLLQAALDTVNWSEIADDFLSDTVF